VAAGDDDGDGVHAEPGGADAVCVAGAGQRWLSETVGPEWEFTTVGIAGYHLYLPLVLVQP